ncbi:MAG: nuclear transport factor 2 family protein [Nocardioidaceae bacterium]|nr:nuclear transport factor 2 family protein [Nocardioidaceae bacterium]
MPNLTTEDVLEAADHLVAAFAATDTDAYFDCFAEDATFVFHPEPARLDDRAAYERLWATWLADGWKVLECESTARLVQLLGDVAVFSHDVRTVTTDGETHERETIVFTRQGERVLAVHEHLSPQES